MINFWGWAGMGWDGKFLVLVLGWDGILHVTKIAGMVMGLSEG